MEENRFDELAEEPCSEGGENGSGEKSVKADKKDKDDGNRGNSSLELYDWVECIVSAIVILIFVFIFVARVVNVDGRSMYPTLHNGDKIITSKLFYKPKPKDVVVVQTNTFGPDPLVKRIVAVGGQTVDIDFNSGIVYVDGEPQDEPYINEPTYRRLDFKGKVTVPEGCLFVMGDNRNGSTDSRSDSVGMVDERCVIGKVIFIAIPRDEKKLDWSRLGAVNHG